MERTILRIGSIRSMRAFKSLRKTADTWKLKNCLMNTPAIHPVTNTKVTTGEYSTIVARRKANLRRLCVKMTLSKRNGYYKVILNSHWIKLISGQKAFYCLRRSETNAQ